MEPSGGDFDGGTAGLAVSESRFVQERLRERIINNAALQSIPRFEEATFFCSVKSARIAIGGDLEITLSVQPSEKYRAIALTDAVGIQVMIQATRKRRASIKSLLYEQEEQHDDDDDS